MIVHIEADCEPQRDGVLARAVRIGVAQVGIDEGDALRALRSTVLAWCHGLAAVDSLEAALGQRRIQWDASGGAIDVVVTPISHG
ncbi:MAG TPA: hypothetical protein VLM76_04730 [Patescibacteria group bacterium]|nr:hypothetical protein [Patescibacteria group bacterium]